MNSTTMNDDPAAIERDIRRTQEDMSRTVDKIGDQLTAKNLFNALLERADDNGVDGQYLIDGARRNPIALGLIAAGAIWLVSDKDSKFPSLPSKSKGKSWDDQDATSDFDHRDYVSHMASIEMREGEDPKAYQRRRDTHRANYLMCERRTDEDDTSFRQRLDDMTEAFRQKRRAWMDSTSHGASATRQKAGAAASRVSTRAQDMFDSNPLVGGILAAAVGAAIGSTIPVTRTEQEKLGPIGSKARDMASEQKEQLTGQLRDKKDELLEKVDEKIQASQSSGGSQSAQSHGSSPQADRVPEAPFIISERT